MKEKRSQSILVANHFVEISPRVEDVEVERVPVDEVTVVVEVVVVDEDREEELMKTKARDQAKAQEGPRLTFETVHCNRLDIDCIKRAL